MSSIKEVEGVVNRTDRENIYTITGFHGTVWIHPEYGPHLVGKKIRAVLHQGYAHHILHYFQVLESKPAPSVSQHSYFHRLETAPAQAPQPPTVSPPPPSIQAAKAIEGTLGGVNWSFRQLPLDSLVEGTTAGRDEVETDAGLESDLRESIRQHKVVIPILVSPRGDGRWEIVAGHRRVARTRECDLPDIPAMIPDRPLTEKEKYVLALTENIHRFTSFTQLQKDIKGLLKTQKEEQPDRSDREIRLEIGRLLGKSETWVERFLKLSEEELGKVDRGEATFRQVYLGRGKTSKSADSAEKSPNHGAHVHHEMSSFPQKEAEMQEYSTGNIPTGIESSPESPPRPTQFLAAADKAGVQLTPTEKRILEAKPPSWSDVGEFQCPLCHGKYIISARKLWGECQHKLVPLLGEVSRGEGQG